MVFSTNAARLTGPPRGVNGERQAALARVSSLVHVSTVIHSPPAAPASARGRATPSSRRITPWLVSAALFFVLPIAVVAIGNHVAHRATSWGEAGALLALQGVGMLAGYVVAAWRRAHTSVLQPWAALQTVAVDASAEG